MVWLGCKNYLRLAKFKYQGLTSTIIRKKEGGRGGRTMDKKKQEFKGQKIKADKMASV